MSGHPPGILSLSPRVLQCEECGVTADAATVGLPETALKQPQRTDNPRLCRACRLARGCHCWSCDWVRRGRR